MSCELSAKLAGFYTQENNGVPSGTSKNRMGSILTTEPMNCFPVVFLSWNLSAKELPSMSINDQVFENEVKPQTVLDAFVDVC